jgi:hypothetical protein
MRDKGKSPPVARRCKGDRFGISISWGDGYGGDGYMISGLPNSTNEVQRLVWIVEQLEKDYQDIYASLTKKMPPLGYRDLHQAIQDALTKHKALLSQKE